MSLLDEVLERIQGMTPEAQKALAKEVMSHPVAGGKWIPNPGPQTVAYFSEADVLLYGGEAGGGKSGLLIGLSLTKHKRSLLMRRQYTDLSALIEDSLEKYGSRKGFSGAPPARLRTDDGRLVEFGAAKLPDDVEHWKGQPHDFLGLDEAGQFLESQVRYLMGWVRSIDPDQRCRTVLATNPPEKPGEGEFLKQMFAPWLDKAHPHPAKAGELRWCVSDEDGHDFWVDGPELVEVGGREVKPHSRTFIPASLDDNPFLKDTDYRAKLDALPEPLRSAVRDGNWMISHKDDEWQVIPTNWVLQAQQRWTREPPQAAPMSSIGVDVAQGGENNTVLAPRYDAWFAEIISVPGKETPLPTDVAGLVFKHRRNEAHIIVDMGGGYGGGVYSHLHANNIPVTGHKGAEGSAARTQPDRLLGFHNKRTEVWWRFREALDPDQPGGSPVALPHDPELVSDLTAVRYDTERGVIRLEAKDKLTDRLGRSTDKGDAVVMAWVAGPTYVTHGQIWREATRTVKHPRVVRGHEKQKRAAGRRV